MATKQNDAGFLGAMAEAFLAAKAHRRRGRGHNRGGRGRGNGHMNHNARQADDNNQVEPVAAAGRPESSRPVFLNRAQKRAIRRAFEDHSKYHRSTMEEEIQKFLNPDVPASERLQNLTTRIEHLEKTKERLQKEAQEEAEEKNKQ